MARSTRGGGIARMCSVWCIVLVTAAGFGGSAFGAGMAFNENFNVMAPDTQTAQAVLARAEALRKEIAQQWLGEELAPGDGRTLITVIEALAEDSGLTWPIDTPERRHHKIWLWGPSGAVSDTTLRHEITHVVFATKFGDRLPAWVNEGISSLSDDPDRRAIRSRIVREIVQTGRWPSLAPLFAQSSLPRSEQALYAASTSLVEFLLERGDRATLLRFALSGKAHGWESALQEHYSFRNLAKLEQAWQSWVVQQVRAESRGQPLAGRYD